MRFKTILFTLVVLVFGGVKLHAHPAGSIPFEFKDGLIWVKVDAGKTRLNFVVDSGAGCSVLNVETAKRLKVNLGYSLSVQGVNSAVSASRASGFMANLNGVPLATNPLAMNLQGASSVCSRPIDGLIGQDFFRGRVVRIDFKSRRITLQESADASRSIAVLPIRYHMDAMCIPLSVNGLKPEWTRLDTGCNSALEWTRESGRSHWFNRTSIGFGGASGNSVLTDLQLGSHHLASIRTGLHSSAMFPGEAGLLGTGVLSKFCVTIDARKMKVILDPL